MCDAVSTSIILGTLALVPGTISRYVCLALASASVFLAARHQSSAQRFTKLEDAIKDLEDILERAKTASSYARNHLEVIDVGCRLLQVKLSASKIQSDLLDMRNATWKAYFKSIRAILRTIDQCAKEAKEIQTAMLLIIEEERQRKLTEGIKESQEVLGVVVLRHAYRRSDSDSHVFQEYYTEPPTIYVLGVAHDAEEDEDRERVHSPGVRLAFARGVISLGDGAT
ncbi:hypothetical protein B0H13DRAFT_2338018 [Mycena leptocephala]|nr:hypothetical protein B0H13DRAFT_2338018 [Mycena leptocephala]